jgi:hypothetical protein
MNRQGMAYTAKLLAQRLALPAWRRLARVDARHFVYRGRAYSYFLARYRTTWSNERAVEIALALELLGRYPPDEVLEIGNCAGHYVARCHRVVDRYERAAGVENVDVLSVAPEPRYPLVLSISTLEHVGWDERPREPGKAARAIAHLRRCVAPGGLLFFTVPLGYNAELDAWLDTGEHGLTRVDCLERTGDLDWSETPWPARTRSTYGEPFPCANAIAIGVYQAPAG